MRRGAAEAVLAAGERTGPLHGVPVSIKDLVYTRGVRTTRGSAIYADLVPDEDAPVVERLRAAGAISLGKTNTPEFGWKGLTDNRLFPPTRNPWDGTRTAGGVERGRGGGRGGRAGANRDWQRRGRVGADTRLVLRGGRVEAVVRAHSVLSGERGGNDVAHGAADAHRGRRGAGAGRAGRPGRAGPADVAGAAGAGGQLSGCGRGGRARGAGGTAGRLEPDAGLRRRG